MRKVEENMSRAAATTFVHTLSTTPFTDIKNCQIPDDLRSALAKLNLTEQHSLINRAQYFLAVDLNAQALQRQLHELEIRRENYEIENNYLLLGAPLVLMRRLFGMHASEFSRRRYALNIQSKGRGRPPQCDETTEHRLWTLWCQHQDQEERLRFMSIAEHTNLDLHVIWGALRPHIDK